MGDATTYSKILYYGSYANYKAIQNKDSNVLYYCDNGKLYKGTVDYTDAFVYTTSDDIPAAAQAVPGKIYYESDTKKFKVLNGTKTAYIEIGNPIDIVGDSTTHTLSSASSDEHVPSSKNVWLYGQAIKAEVIGGTDVVSNVTASDNSGAIIVTYGDDSTSEVVIPNAITGIKDSTTTDAQLIISHAGAADTNVTITGVVTTPTWDSTNLKLTLPVSGGNNVEVNIPKDIFLKEGSYDATNKQIVLVLNDTSETEIRFSVEDLIPIYDIADTTTVDMSIDWDATNGKHVISGEVNVSATAGQGLTVENDGLYVDISGFATTSDFETLEASHNNLAGAFTWGTF